MKRPAFETSPETLAIFARMERALIGEAVPYAQILDLAGFRDISHARPYINSARRQLWRQHVYTRCERKVGIIRTDGDGAVDVAQRKEEIITRAQRRVRRQWEQIVDASAEKLAVKTKALYKHEMTAALNRLFRRQDVQLPQPGSKPVDPKKVISLFAKRA